MARRSPSGSAIAPLVAPLVGAILLLCGTASAQTIVNGSFETGPDPGSFTNLPLGSTAITGWTVVTANVDYIGTLWEHADGKRSVDLGGGIGAAGAVRQDIATAPGELYHVAFALAGNWGGAPIKTLRVTAAGATQDYLFDTTGRGANDMGWVERVFSFTATGTTTTLTFTSLDANFGPAIDNVRMTELGAIPTTGRVGRAILAGLLLATGVGLLRRQRARRERPSAS